MVLVSFGLLMGVAVGARAGEHHKKLALKDFPAVVQKALREESTGWKMKAVWTEKENGAIEYHAALIKGRKLKKEIAVGPDGKYLGSEEAIHLRDIPEAARDTIQKETKGHKIKELEKSTDAGGKVFYEFELKDKKGEVRVNPDGTMAPPEAGD